MSTLTQTHSRPTEALAASRTEPGEFRLTPELTAEFLAHFKTLSSLASRVLPGAKQEEDREQLLRAAESLAIDDVPQYAWSLARMVEERLGGIKSFETAEGPLARNDFVLPFLAAAELLSVAARGEQEDRTTQNESFTLTCAAVRNALRQTEAVASRILDVIPYDPKELRAERVQERLEKRRAHRERTAHDKQNSDFTAHRTTVQEALERAAQHVDKPERIEAARQRAVPWIKDSIEELKPRHSWKTVAAMVAAPLAIAAGAALAKSALPPHWAGYSGIIISAQIALQFAAMYAIWKFSNKSSDAQHPALPSIPPALPDTSIGSYVSRDPSFARRMSVTQAKVLIPPFGSLMPLETWLEKLPALFPGAADLPSRSDFFRSKAVPPMSGTLADGETEITLPLSRFPKVLPLNPCYTITGLKLLDAQGQEVHAKPIAIEEGVLGSAVMLSPVPKEATQVCYRVQLNSEPRLAFDSIERIKKYLPPHPSSGTQDIIRQREALGFLYPDDAVRATRWIEQLRNHHYRSCDDPELSPLLAKFGGYWGVAFHAHRTGNCDYFAAHATAELCALGTAAFWAGGLAADPEQQAFLAPLAHAQSAVLCPGGTKFFDLTINAQRVGKIDLDRLSDEERKHLLSRDRPESADDAFIRGELLAKAIDPVPDGKPLNRGHNFKDDSSGKLSQASEEALSYISEILELKKSIAACRRKGYEGFADLLADAGTLDLLYTPSPREDDGLSTELRSSRWPPPDRLVLAAAGEALGEPSVSLKDKRSIITFLVARTGMTTQQTPDMNAAGEKFDAIVRELAACKSNAERQALMNRIATQGLEFPMAVREYPPIYSACDVKKAIPEALYADREVFDRTLSNLSMAGLLSNAANELLAHVYLRNRADQRQDLSITGDCLSQPHELETREAAIDLISSISSSLSKTPRNQDVLNQDTLACVQAAVRSLVLINSFYAARLTHETPDGLSTQRELDELTYGTIAGLARETGVSPRAILAYGFLCCPPGPRARSVETILYDAYIQRELVRYGEAPATRERNWLLPAAAGRAASWLQTNTGLDRWLSTLEAIIGPLDFQGLAASHVDHFRTYIDSAAKLGFGSADMRLPAQGLIQSAIVHPADEQLRSMLKVDQLGFFGEPGTLSTQIPPPRDAALAEVFAGLVTFDVVRGAPVLRLEGGIDSKFSPSIIRIPWVTKLLPSSRSEQADAIRAAQILGGIDEETQKCFTEFERAYPAEAGRAAVRLDSILDSAGLDGSLPPAQSLHTPDQGEDNPSPVQQPGEGTPRLDAAIRQATVWNAYATNNASEIYTSIRWLLALSAQHRGLTADLQTRAAHFVRDLAASQDTTGTTLPPDESFLRQLMTKHGLDADDSLVPVRGPQSVRAKAAAVLCLSLYFHDLQTRNIEAFSSLCSGLGVPSFVFEPLTREMEVESRPRPSTIARHILRVDKSDSCITRSDLQSVARHLERSRSRSPAVTRSFAEFYDIVLRGNRTPPGESGIYESFRSYSPGTSAKHIDWKAYARTDRLLVKTRVEELARPSILVVDAESFAPVVERRDKLLAEGEHTALPPELLILLKEMRSLDEHATHAAMVVTSGGAPVSIHLTPHSRIRHVFEENPATAGLCTYVPRFSSLASIRWTGKTLSSVSFHQRLELMIGGMWQHPAPSFSLSWLRRDVPGLRVKILGGEQRFRHVAEDLAPLHSRLRRGGGEVVIASF